MRKALVSAALLLALVAVPVALADTTTTTFHLDFVAVCPSENVAISADVVSRTSSTTNPTGGFTAHITDIVSGTGTGLVTGTTYTLRGVTETSIYFRDPRTFSQTADVFESAQTWVLVPTGGGKPLSFQETLLGVINANGERVVISGSEPECN